MLRVTWERGDTCAGLREWRDPRKGNRESFRDWHLPILLKNKKFESIYWIKLKWDSFKYEFFVFPHNFLMQFFLDFWISGQQKCGIGQSGGGSVESGQQE